MMTDYKQISGYRCNHCKKILMTKKGIEKHVVGCWYNPNHVPQLGTLTTVQYLYRADEPWHPGEPGMCYTEDGWQAVPGYEATVSDHPSDEGEYTGEETWPEVCAGWDDGGVPQYVEFNNLNKRERVEYMADLKKLGGD